VPRAGRLPRTRSIKTGPCSGYVVLRGEKALDDALARELGAMRLALSQRARR